jgi:hypothetical protein
VPIKKAVIPSEMLPLTTAGTKYYVRYRAVSDDGTLKSQWSSFYELSGNTVQDFTGETSPADTLSASVSSDQRYITLQWDILGGSVLKSSLFDIFSQWSTAAIPTWNASNYEYVGTISANTFSIPIPEGSTYGKFAVQLATQDKLITSDTITDLGLGEVISDTVYDAPDFDGGEI